MSYQASDALVNSRLKLETKMEFQRRKTHTLRQVAAGDYSPIDENFVSQIDPTWDDSDQLRSSSELYDLFVSEVTEGTTNFILQGIRTLLLSTASRFPSFEFDDLEGQLGDFHQAYMARRLGPKPYGCDAVHHQRLALVDYIISGLGWSWAGLGLYGKPFIANVDSLDMTYDLNAKTIHDIQWAHARVVQPLWYWETLFDKADLKKAGVYEKTSHQDLEINPTEDMPLALAFYFDVIGDQGTMAVKPLRQMQDGSTGEFIVKQGNPHYMDVEGFQQPFIPFEPLYHMNLPSLRHHVGIVELMVSHQMATRRAEKNMQEAIDRLRPYIEVEKNSYDDKARDEIESGKGFVIVERNENKPTAEVKLGANIEPALFQYRDQNRDSMVGQSGQSPYASGSKTLDVDYAAEVNAIREQGGLMTSAILADHADHWRRIGHKVLANGKAYDTHPITLRVADVLMDFDQERPVNHFLDASEMPDISEESLAFENKERKQAEAQAILEVSTSVMDIFPKARAVAFEDFLKAAGKKNLTEWLAPPDVVPQDQGAAEVEEKADGADTGQGAA